MARLPLWIVSDVVALHCLGTGSRRQAVIATRFGGFLTRLGGGSVFLFLPGNTRACARRSFLSEIPDRRSEGHPAANSPCKGLPGIGGVTLRATSAAESML